MFRNIFAALAPPLSYGMVKYGATAAVFGFVTARFTTSLNANSFSRPTLFGLRYTAKVVDVVGSAIYNYYFRSEIQEAGKTIGHYIEIYGPDVIDTTLKYSVQLSNDYLIPVTSSVLRKVHYYLTPFGIVIVKWTKDVITSIEFAKHAQDFKEFLDAYDLHINLYTLPNSLLDTSYALKEILDEYDLHINLYSFPIRLLEASYALKETLDEYDYHINLYDILSGVLNFALAVVDRALMTGRNVGEFFLEWAIYLFEVLNELSFFIPDLTPLIDGVAEVLDIIFQERDFTPLLELLAVVLEERDFTYVLKFLSGIFEEQDFSFVILYFDSLLVKLIEFFNDPDLTLEQILELAKEQAEVYKIAFKEWWSQPSDFNEHASYFLSSYFFEYCLFIAGGKIIFEDNIKSAFLKVILGGIILNDLGEIFRKFAEDVHSKIVAQKNLPAIGPKAEVLNPALSDKEEAVAQDIHPFQPPQRNLKMIDIKADAVSQMPVDKEEATPIQELIPNTNCELSGKAANASHIVSLEFCFLANLTRAEVPQQLVPQPEEDQNEVTVFTTTAMFFMENNSQLKEVGESYHSQILRLHSECFESNSYYP